MKLIVIPTDFSVPAEKAMIYGAQLAKNMEASILLLHVYQIPVGMNDMPVIMVNAADLKNSVDAGLTRAKEILLSHVPGIDVKTESRMGDVVDEVNDVCEKENPFCIVAGRHGATGVERVLFGSTSLSIVRHSQFPVIVVPDTYLYQSIKNIAVAVDTIEQPLPGEKIKSLVGFLNAKLHIIHVNTSNENAQNFIPAINDVSTNFTTIKNDNLIHGLEAFINKERVDLLVIFPHKHSFFERIFSTSHTSELVQKVSIPVMCIGED